MIIGVTIDFLCGAVCCILGFLIWKKRMLSILHEYHYKNVKSDDIPAYTRQIGIGLLVIGAGIILEGVLDLLHSSFWWIPLSAGLATGIIVMYRAQKKYNGSVLG